MFDVLVWGLIGAILVWTIFADLKAGTMRLPRPGGPARGKRQLLKRAEYPLVFMSMLVLRTLASIVLALILTGRLLPLLQWGI